MIFTWKVFSLLSPSLIAWNGTTFRRNLKALLPLPTPVRAVALRLRSLQAISSFLSLQPSKNCSLFLTGYVCVSVWLCLWEKWYFVVVSVCLFCLFVFCLLLFLICYNILTRWSLILPDRKNSKGMFTLSVKVTQFWFIAHSSDLCHDHVNCKKKSHGFWFPQIGFGPLSYVVINQIWIGYMLMRLQCIRTNQIFPTYAIPTSVIWEFCMLFIDFHM